MGLLTSLQDELTKARVRYEVELKSQPAQIINAYTGNVLPSPLDQNTVTLRKKQEAELCRLQTEYEEKLAALQTLEDNLEERRENLERDIREFIHETYEVDSLADFWWIAMASLFQRKGYC